MKKILTVFTSCLFLHFASPRIIPVLNRTELEQNELTHSDGRSDGTLIFAHVIFRHGARNIGKTYPNDPNKDEKYWPEGFKQLTEIGKRQQHLLGKYLRSRYNKLINAEYSPEELYVQSSDVDRALISAQANLAGLFEPINKGSGDKNIMYMSIPVHTMPSELDYILKCGKECPSYEKAFKNYVKQSEEVQKIYEEYEDLFVYWSEMCGKKIRTIEDVHWLWKILFTEKFQNKKLPDWAEKAMEPNGVMETIAMYHHSMAAATPKLARLKSGFLLKQIFERFSHKINATLQPDRSLWLYSAHETTIANMLNSLGLFKIHIPPYASSLHFELYKSGEEHYIQLFYRQSNEEDPSPMDIPQCGPKCSLKELYKIYDEIIPEDFESECSLS